MGTRQHQPSRIRTGLSALLLAVLLIGAVTAQDESAPAAPATETPTGEPDSPAVQPDADASSDESSQPSSEAAPEVSAENKAEAVYHYALAREHVAAERFDEAIREFEEAIRLDPTSTLMLRELADACFQKGDVDKSRELYQKALSIDPHDTESLYALGRQCLNQNDYDKAGDYFQQVLDKSKDAASDRFVGLSLYLYGRIYASQKKMAEEAATYDRLSRWLDKSPAAMQRDPELSRMVSPEFLHVLVGRTVQLYMRLKESEKAVTLLKDMTGVLEKPGLGPSVVIWLLNNKHNDLALDLAREIQRRRPEDAAAYNLLARVFEQSGDHDGFVKTFRELVEQHPGQSTISLLLGQELLRAGKVDDGVALIESILNRPDSQIPDNVNDSAMPAIVNDLLAKGHAEAAVKVALAVQRRWPTDAAGYELLTQAYDKLGNDEEFIRQLREFHDAHPELAVVTRLLGEKLIKAGQGEEGAQFLEELVKSGDAVVAGAVRKSLLAYYQTGQQPAQVLKLYAQTVSEKSDCEWRYWRAQTRLLQLQNRDDAGPEQYNRLRKEVGELEQQVEQLDELVEQLANFIDEIEDRPAVLAELRSLLADDLQSGSGPAFVLGMVAQVDDPAAAAEDFRTLLKVSPRFARGYERLTAVLIRLDRLMDALDSLREGVERLESLGWKTVFFRRMARIYEMVDRDADAIMTYQTILKLNQRDNSSRYNLSGVLARMGQLDQARELMEEAIEADPMSSRPYIEMALFLRDQGDSDAALLSVDRGLDQMSDDQQLGALLYYKAFLLDGRGDLDDAMETVDRLAGITTFENEAKRLRADVLMSMEKYDEARKIIDELLAKEPDGADTLQLLATWHDRRGERDEAESVMEGILKKHPRDSGINNNLGYMWADRGVRLAESEQMIRLSLQENPESSATLDSLGWVLYKQNQMAQAVVYLQRSLRLNPQASPVIWDHLGDTLVRLNRMDEARAAYQRAVELLERRAVRLQRDEQQIRETVPRKLEALDGGKAVPTAPLGRGVSENESGRP
ncbi:MAG: tetratricopeptide repeat protein [Planctomycetes bacterium]|nr:tetratricopeptide repeat protein [Planctomycetota bacterium]